MSIVEGIVMFAVSAILGGICPSASLTAPIDFFSASIQSPRRQTDVLPTMTMPKPARPGL